MSSEFDIIQDYFNWQQTAASVRVGVGDDAAVLDLTAKQGQELIISVDTFIEGVHFPKNAPVEAIGHKALAVNLSDLAAMGAEPAWFTLAITLPESNQQWLKAFSLGLKKLADQHNIVLIGGDTTRGSLSITIQVMGFVTAGEALLRSTAKPNDKIYVSGYLGDAAIGLALIQARLKADMLSQTANTFCRNALNFPYPQNTLSKIIRPYATACLDISDGLLQDLTHILKASNVSARLDSDKIPLSSHALELGYDTALPYALSGGDDYQLLFTVPPENEAKLLKRIADADESISCIGTIGVNNDDKIRDSSGNLISTTGYQHFYGE
ncbi:MAG: thiamine-phosphate kinase [Aquificaceae bacterium]|nr:MAG: thiamine-phosphate kinase [Aquificaceae bacterium]